MTNSEDKDSIEEILNLHLEHKEKIEAIETKLDDIKETVDLFYQIFKYISNDKLKSEPQISLPTRGCMPVGA